MIRWFLKYTLALQILGNTAGSPKTLTTNFMWLWVLRTQVQTLTFIFTRFSPMMSASTATSSGFHNLYRSLLWPLLMCLAATGWCSWMRISLCRQVVRVMQSRALLKGSASHAQRTTEPFSTSRLSAWVATKWSSMTWQATWATKLMSQSQSARTPIQKFQPPKAPLMLFSQISACSQCGHRLL